MWKMLKQAGYFLVIIMLLPYIITVFVNGNGMTLGVNISGNAPYITVKEDDKEREMLLEEYGIGVLAKEIDAEVSAETLKAQAVLIRTSIYKTIQEEGSSAVLTGSYWTRTQMKNNWGSEKYGEYYEKMKNAWSETEGEVLLYEGKLALTPYHKLSNGKTRSGNEVFQTEDYSYLAVKECPDDAEAEDAMTTTLIQGTNMTVTKNDSAGYVSEVKCGEQTVTGEEFRDLYHLASASFTLQDYEGQTRVISQGIGHGLGMSQNYANILAEQGNDYKKILEYFFEGTVIEEVAEIIVQKTE